MMQEVHEVGPYPVLIETYDDKGNINMLTISQKPQRVLVYEFNVLQTLVALGQSDRIIGASANINRLKQLQQRYPDASSRIGHIYPENITNEEALALQPDLIIGWKSSFISPQLKPTSWWNERGINTYIVATSNHVLQRGTIEDECRFLNDMGIIFDVKDKTDILVEDIHREIRRVRVETNGRIPQKTMVIELMGRTIINYDSGWIVGDMVQQLGGIMPVTSKRVGYEDLIDEDPDVIFVNYFNEEQKQKIAEFFKNPEFSSMKAVQKHRIYPFPFECMYTPEIKTIDGIRIVRDGLYPDLAGT